MLIAIGIESSTILHDRTVYPLPSIATMVVEPSTKNKSGISNYTWSTPYKSITEIITYFSKLFDIDHIGVVSNTLLLAETNLRLANAKISAESLSVDATHIPNTIQGILLPPPSFQDEKKVEAFIQKANEKGIPTFSLLDAYNNFGWTASINDDAIITPLIKQAALNTLYIFEGKNAAEISIHKNTTPFQVILNMKGIRTIQKLPEWSYFDNAILVNVAQSPNATPLTISEAIAIGLREKLS